jgi:hypothetical protein
MTLVAGLSIGTLPAFVGDLLLSWRLSTKVDLPTSVESGIFSGSNGLHAAGLAQKLIIVRPYLMIAWAGIHSRVETVVRELDRILPNDFSSVADPEVILKVLDSVGQGVELLALLADGKQLHPFCIGTRGFEIDNRRVYLMGSGAPHFFEYLQEHPDMLPNQDRADGLLARATLVRFAARLMTLQLKLGFGIDELWGGGFEIAYPGKHGFQKVTNLLIRAWLISKNGTYRDSGRSFFLRYYGRDLHLSWFNPEERTFVIRSPLSGVVEIPKHEIVGPEWTLDFFVMEETGSFIDFCRHETLSKQNLDSFEMNDGVLVGWSMDRTYVDCCVDLARSSQHRAPMFKITRN